MEIKRQWRNIESSQSQFTQSYMEDRYFVPFWTEGLHIVKGALRNNRASTNAMKKRSDFVRILTEYEDMACTLQQKLIDASGRGLLEDAVMFSIQDRWVKLDEVLKWYYDSQNRVRDKNTPPSSPTSLGWYVL